MFDEIPSGGSVSWGPGGGYRWGEDLDSTREREGVNLYWVPPLEAGRHSGQGVPEGHE